MPRSPQARCAVGRPQGGLAIRAKAPAGHCVERHDPATHPHGLGVLFFQKGIVCGNAISCRLRNIDAENLREESVEGLAVFVRIIARAAVSVGNVKHVVRTKSKPPAVMILKLGRVFQNDFFGGMIGGPAVFRSESNDPRLLFLIRVIHIEAPAF